MPAKTKRTREDHDLVGEVQTGSRRLKAAPPGADLPLASARQKRRTRQAAGSRDGAQGARDGAASMNLGGDHDMTANEESASAAQVPSDLMSSFVWESPRARERDCAHETEKVLPSPREDSGVSGAASTPSLRENGGTEGGLGSLLRLRKSPEGPRARDRVDGAGEGSHTRSGHGAEGPDDLEGFAGLQGFKSYIFQEISNHHSLLHADADAMPSSESGFELPKMVRVPMLLEKTILVGFVVCADSFLFNFTLLPIRSLFGLADHLSLFVSGIKHTISCSVGRRGGEAGGRGAARLNKDDLIRFFLLVCSLMLLRRVDMSYLYHYIRGQMSSYIKLYVIYNVLEVFDKLCCSIGQDILNSMLKWGAPPGSSAQPWCTSSRTPKPPPQKSWDGWEWDGWECMDANGIGSALLCCLRVSNPQPRHPLTLPTAHPNASRPYQRVTGGGQGQVLVVFCDGVGDRVHEHPRLHSACPGPLSLSLPPSRPPPPLYTSLYLCPYVSACLCLCPYVCVCVCVFV
jgi:hypothetical protein